MKSTRHLRRRQTQKNKRKGNKMNNNNNEVKIEIEAVQPQANNVEPQPTLTPEMEEAVNNMQLDPRAERIDFITKMLSDEIQQQMMDGSLDYDLCEESDKKCIDEIFSVMTELMMDSFGGKEAFGQSAFDMMVVILTDLTKLRFRPQLGYTEKKSMVIKAMDTMIFCVGDKASEKNVGEFLNVFNESLGLDVKVNDIPAMQSPEVSTADVKEEAEWFNGGNMLVMGAGLGAVFNILVKGVTPKSMIVGAATTIAAVAARDKATEIAGDSSFKKCAAAGIGAGVSIGALKVTELLF